MRFLAKSVSLILMVGIFAGVTLAQKTEPPRKAPPAFIAMFTMPPPGQCPPCDAMKPIVLDLHKRGFPITIIADGDLASRLGVKGFPTFFGIVEGKIATARIGICTEQELINLIPSNFWPEGFKARGLGTILRAGNPGVVQPKPPKVSGNRDPLQGLKSQPAPVS